jgi:hypothetical protein
MLTPAFERAFKNVYGKPCRSAKPGYGSFLTFEFGEPHLEIREPRDAPKRATRKVRELFARRGVAVHGEWHLWVYECDWEILVEGRRIANNRSSWTYERGTNRLDGQKLMRFSLQPRGLQSIFEFDLGGVLVTRPYDRSGEQWILFCPSKKVLTLRADSKYAFHASNLPEDQAKWESVVSAGI